MQITHKRLREIVIEELTLSEIVFEAPVHNKTSPVSDEVILAILNALPSKLNEAVITEDLKDRIRAAVEKLGGDADAIKRVAVKTGVPIVMITSILAGAGAGSQLASRDNVSQDNIELATQQDDTFYSFYGSAFDSEEYSGLSNSEKLEKAWEGYQIDRATAAPVASKIWGFTYTHIPPEQLNDNSILPHSGTTARKYYNKWKKRVLANPQVELPLLKNMVFGDTSKWSGGVGGKSNFAAGPNNSRLLPPDWTVAHTLYADIMEDKIGQLYDYHEANPDAREELYKSLGVNGEDAFYKFVSDSMYSIGRDLVAQ